MSNKTKIYTKTGDLGETCLFDGSRTSKDDVRLDLIGDIDELSANLGLIYSHLENTRTKQIILAIINDLFRLNAHLAGAPQFAQVNLSDNVVNLELSIDEMDEDLNELKNFIYPVGNIAIATTHVARTICRRAERKLVRASIDFSFNATGIQYLNRLSDWLFTLARYIAHINQVTEIPLIT